MEIRALGFWMFTVCLLPAAALAQAPQSSSNPAERSLRDQGGSPAATISIAPKIDPAKEAAIRKLIQLTAGADLVNQLMDEMQKNMKPMMANLLPPGGYRDRLIDLFFAKFRSKLNVQDLIDLAVRTYDKYLTMEDIDGLIQFYETPLGQKTISVLPKLTIEIQTESMKRGQELGRQSMQEVLSEHPDLRQALQAASKNAKPN
jgi:hypothetical protein